MGHNCVLWLAALTIFFGNVCSFKLPADFPGKECTPGETKQVDCNSCWCTPDGYWGCTRLGCETRQTRDTEKECTPGETKQVDCNSCWCTPDGYWGCTRLGCETRQTRDTDEECTDEDTKWDGNNHCVCHDNKWSCHDVGGPCKPGEKKMKDCNECYCNHNGVWYCTLIGCEDDFFATRQERSAESVCTEDSVKYEGDMFCKCKDNKWDCQINEFAEPCKPGERKSADCNGCWCTDDGIWACTIMFCPPIPKNESHRQEEEAAQSSKAIREKRNAEPVCTEDAVKFEDDQFCKCKDNKWDCQINEFAQPCEPGERKAADCNLCWCTDDGSWACTLKFCPPIPKNETQLQEEETTTRKKRNSDQECTDEETKWEGTSYCACIDKKWHCENIGGECKPGEGKQEDCNSCSCIPPGIWMCTLKGCSPPIHIIETTQSSQTIREKRNADEECTDMETKWEGNDYCICHDKKWRCQYVGGPCKPGETKMEDCNHCFCTETGLWGCTLMGCSKHNLAIREERSAGEQCRPGESTMKDCNYCICGENGLWMCTLKGCLPPNFTIGEETTQSSQTNREKRNADEECTDMKTKWEGNDYCVCHDKKWRCQDVGGPCKPGETKMEDCSHCFCTETGLWGCTLLGCSKYNLAKREERSAECIEDERKWMNNDTVHCICMGRQWRCSEVDFGRCTPGDYMRDKCDDCFCTDVELWGCTKRNCVPDYDGDDSCHNPGRARWIGPNYSQYCYCTSDYKWKCEDLGGPCKYNETKMEDCNLCKCNEHGLWDCEKNECTKLSKREADDYCLNKRTKFDGNQYCKCVSHKWKCQEIGRPCPTDNKKWEVCNRANNCTCLDLGVNSCHRTKNCTHAVLKKQEEEEEKCSPLSPPKKKGCNYCFCTNRGLWVCTQNECGQLSKRSAEQFTCMPGQTFQKECNSCTCTKDGKNAVCTLKNCTLEE